MYLGVATQVLVADSGQLYVQVHVYTMMYNDNSKFVILEGMCLKPAAYPSYQIYPQVLLCDQL